MSHPPVVVRVLFTGCQNADEFLAREGQRGVFIDLGVFYFRGRVERIPFAFLGEPEEGPQAPQLFDGRKIFVRPRCPKFPQQVYGKLLNIAQAPVLGESFKLLKQQPVFIKGRLSEIPSLRVGYKLFASLVLGLILLITIILLIINGGYSIFKNINDIFILTLTPAFFAIIVFILVGLITIFLSSFKESLDK